MRIEHILVRVFVADLDATIPFYVELTGQEPGIRFAHGALELAAVGNFLLIAGPQEATASLLEVRATVRVDDLDGFIHTVLAAGGGIVRGPQAVPTGRNAVLRHADGTVLEYVEHRQDTMALREGS